MMTREIANFKLSLFDKFVSSYQDIISLLLETSEAFNQFLPALNNFFEIWEDLIECDIDSLTTVRPL